MRRLRCAMVVSISVACVSSDEGSCALDGQCAAADPDLECTLFMAPSILGDRSNLGIFTTKSMWAGDVVPYPEIAIPIEFRNWNKPPPYAQFGGEGSVWDRYLWEAQILNGNDIQFDPNDGRAVFVPGVGCTVNSWLDLGNVDSARGGVYEPHDSASSPYHRVATVTTRDVPAGGELLASYGDSWIPTIPNIPVTQNEYLDKANTFIYEFFEWTKSMQGKHGDGNEDAIEKLWTKVIRSFAYKSKEFSVLPTVTWKEVETAILRHDNPYNSTSKLDVSREFLRQSAIRPVSWLREHGKCQDHLRPGKSTTGFGAFAVRSLPQGTVMAYAPLIHVTSSDLPYELVINYSFGHPESTVKLTPYGTMVNYINHRSAPQANVRVRWPKNGDDLAHRSDWLERDVSFLRNTVQSVGLAFEYVAIRDIDPGEELFLNYGDVWQSAWDAHHSGTANGSESQKAFRHSLMIPDDVLPTSWKNVAPRIVSD